jgi:hypothetical protein
MRKRVIRAPTTPKFAGDRGGFPQKNPQFSA